MAAALEAAIEERERHPIRTRIRKAGERIKAAFVRRGKRKK